MQTTNDFGAFLYLFCILVLMPSMGVWSWYRLRSGKPLPPKEKRYVSMMVVQIGIFAFSYGVMQNHGIALFASGWPSLWVWCLATAYMALIAQRLKVGWRKISEQRKQRARILLPENSSQMRYWIPISLLAGLSEEFAFRGLAFALVTRLTHSQLLAVAVCTVSFGVAHMMQGWRAVLGTSLIALIMHGLVYLTGGLYLSIAVHAAYDLIVGIIAMRAFQQETATAMAQAQPAS